MLSRILLFTSVVVSCGTMAYAQYGTAPTNYYPATYSGSTFTGEVIDTKNNLITLRYTKNSKADAFIGGFETPCAVPSADGRKMTPSDIPMGTILTAFFNVESKKVNAQKVKENTIIAITFENWQGHKVPEDKRKIYYCTDVRQLTFRYWGK